MDALAVDHVDTGCCLVIVSRSDRCYVALLLFLLSNFRSHRTIRNFLRALVIFHLCVQLDQWTGMSVHAFLSLTLGLLFLVSRRLWAFIRSQS